MEINLLLLIATGLINLLAIYEVFRSNKIIKATSSEIHRSVIHQRELAQLLEIHNQLGDIQGMTESVVDSSAATVRSIHREIANIPFEILESISATRESTRFVKGMHDITADSVYTSISSLNRLMGERLRKQFKLSPDNLQLEGKDEKQE